MDAGAWDSRYADTPMVWSAGPNRFVAEEVGDLSAGRALDLAAGEGRNAIWLAENGWQVTAVDFSRVGLDKGRARAGDLPVEWVCADVLTWQAEAPYDLVVVAYLQLPQAERRTALRRAFAALAPGGTLLVVAHDSSNLTEGTGGPQDPSVLMSAPDLLGDLAEEQGVRVLRAGRVEPTVTVADEHGGEQNRTAYDVLFRVRKAD